jgi:hypothetical protein
MTDQQRPAPSRAERATVTSCWMCGIRLSADQMVADGGSACLDLRWYCRDTRACTGRWTSRSARADAIHQAIAQKRKARGRLTTEADAARTVPV